ncbi:hypothetical protein [Actinoallomurus iriomotensis]|uniref:Uncharacterized protein n=1 Tax=Actinoallomurus iriomotensis TaxID=478107 RepID=A0A9W6S8W6_9ACTN|nr:hypothetical protein [Actinoallomurus iriomotensis]GLY90641.1 hypothetical protein Airi02_085700 [Actinoallomurus iriomotensis]
MRRRVLKRRIRTPWGTSSRPRGRPEMRPAGADLDPGPAEAIGRLSRTERPATGGGETVAELRRLLVSDREDIVRRAVRSVDADTELASDEQRAAVLGLDVETVAFSLRWSPRPAKVRPAALLAGVPTVVVAGVVLGRPEKKVSSLVNARAGTDISLVKEWPAQGDRVHDGALLGRARDAWERVPDSPAEGGEAYDSVALYGLLEVPHPRRRGRAPSSCCSPARSGRGGARCSATATCSRSTPRDERAPVADLRERRVQHQGPRSVSPAPYRPGGTRTAYPPP